ncbi:MAG TPA: CRTAC1 family protein, partial [Planctomycetaceae bacterium]|nr:CRTAC1 family protein [Planctomycetaceae bacterium]
PNNEIFGLPGGLFRNRGGLAFQEVTEIADAAAAPFYSHGASVGDYNSDGFPDLLVTGYGGLVLFCNQGDGTFFETAKAAGLTDTLWSSSAGWGDVNGDGVLDLYVAHYVNWSFANNPSCRYADTQRDVCSPRKFDALPHTLYFGEGDGTFRDVSGEAGLEPDGPTGKGLGVVLADLDLDGKLDIFAANDTTANFLYHNLGNGKLEDVAGVSGTAVSEMAIPNGSMGVDVGDPNLDGLPDLWVAAFERETIALYRNEGSFLFRHVSHASGISAVGSQYVGFGTLFLDFDRDGDEDVVVSNGHVIRFPQSSSVRQLPLLFENRGQRFVNVAPAAGPYLAQPHLGRGVAGGDIDNDGDIDLVFAPINEPAAIVANESPNDNHWLRVRLIGVQSHRDAVGAIVTLVTSAGKQIRLVKGGCSYLSQNEPHCFFGIPKAAQIESLSIRWPSGVTQELTGVKLDKSIVVIEK